MTSSKTPRIETRTYADRCAADPTYAAKKNGKVRHIRDAAFLALVDRVQSSGRFTEACALLATMFVDDGGANHRV